VLILTRRAVNMLGGGLRSPSAFLVAFYDFVYFVSVVSCQFTFSVWNAHDSDYQFPFLVNTSSRSQWMERSISSTYFVWSF